VIKRALLIAVVLSAACDPADNTEPHPTDALDFPVSVTADPSGDKVWVVSGNFDLRFREAAVLAIDVASNTFIDDLAFEVGGFPGELEILADENDQAKAMYIPSREDDRLYFATFKDGKPTCPGGTVKGGIMSCPKSGAIERTKVETKDGSLEIDMGNDPYGAVIVPARGNPGVTTQPVVPDLLLTGAMANGRLAMFQLLDDGTPKLVGGVDLVTGLFGLVTNPKTGRVYASSKLANIVTVLGISPRLDDDKPTQDVLDPVNPFITVAGTVGIPEPRATDRGRAIAVSSDGTRLYVAYRAPDSLVVFDIADSSGGAVRNRVLQKIALDDDPTDLVVVPQADGTDFVYVSCFKADRVEVVDPQDGEIVGGIHVGDGPSGMALIDNGSVRRLYVALFHGNAVGVIELDPTSPFFHTEVGEIR